MNLDRLIQQFDLDNVQKKGAIFDEKKLNWISGQHLSMQTAQYILENIKKLIQNGGNLMMNIIYQLLIYLRIDQLL